MKLRFAACAIGATLLDIPAASADAPYCDVTLAFTAAKPVISITTKVLYTNAPGSFANVEHIATCEFLVPGTTMTSAFDDEEKRRLNVLVTTSPESPMASGTEFVRCKWDPETRFPEMGELTIAPGSTVALDTTGKLLTATAFITDVDCFGDFVTTTTTLPTTTTSTTDTTSTTEPPTTTTLPEQLCGDYDNSGEVKASDALGALRSAVGQATCEACVCDANGSGSVTASDALLVLQFAVGRDVMLTCGAC